MIDIMSGTLARDLYPEIMKVVDDSKKGTHDNDTFAEQCHTKTMTVLKKAFLLGRSSQAKRVAELELELSEKILTALEGLVKIEDHYKMGGDFMSKESYRDLVKKVSEARIEVSLKTIALEKIQ